MSVNTELGIEPVTTCSKFGGNKVEVKSNELAISLLPEVK